MGRVVINGVEIETDDLTGVNISVNDGVVSINGNAVTGKVTEVKVDLQGTLASLRVDRGQVTCENVAGDVKAGNGVNCKDVQGSVEAGNGVVCGNVGGDVEAGNSVECGSVGGDVEAGGSVKCGEVHGDIDAGGSVRHG
jgi:hypothetical protein